LKKHYKHNWGLIDNHVKNLIASNNSKDSKEKKRLKNAPLLLPSRKINRNLTLNNLNQFKKSFTKNFHIDNNINDNNFYGHNRNRNRKDNDNDYIEDTSHSQNQNQVQNQVQNLQISRIQSANHLHSSRDTKTNTNSKTDVNSRNTYFTHSDNQDIIEKEKKNKEHSAKTDVVLINNLVNLEHNKVN